MADTGAAPPALSGSECEDRDAAKLAAKSDGPSALQTRGSAVSRARAAAHANRAAGGGGRTLGPSRPRTATLQGSAAGALRNAREGAREEKAASGKGELAEMFPKGDMESVFGENILDFEPAKSNWANVPLLVRGGIASVHKTCTELKGYQEALRQDVDQVTTDMRKSEINRVSQRDQQQAQLEALRRAVAEFYQAMGRALKSLCKGKKTQFKVNNFLSNMPAILARADTVTQVATAPAYTRRSSHNAPTTILNFAATMQVSSKGVSDSEHKRLSESPQPSRQRHSTACDSGSPSPQGVHQSTPRARIAIAKSAKKVAGKIPHGGNSTANDQASDGSLETSSEEEEEDVSISDHGGRLENCENLLEALRMDLRQQRVESADHLCEIRTQLQEATGELVSVRARLNADLSVDGLETFIRDLSWKSMLEYLPKWHHFLGATKEGSTEAATKFFTELRTCPDQLGSLREELHEVHQKMKEHLASVESQVADFSSKKKLSVRRMETTKEGSKGTSRISRRKSGDRTSGLQTPLKMDAGNECISKLFSSESDPLRRQVSGVATAIDSSRLGSKEALSRSTSKDSAPRASFNQEELDEQIQGQVQLCVSEESRYYKRDQECTIVEDGEEKQELPTVCAQITLNVTNEAGIVSWSRQSTPPDIPQNEADSVFWSRQSTPPDIPQMQSDSASVAIEEVPQPRRRRSIAGSGSKVASRSSKRISRASRSPSPQPAMQDDADGVSSEEDSLLEEVYMKIEDVSERCETELVSVKSTSAAIQDRLDNIEKLGLDELHEKQAEMKEELLTIMTAKALDTKNDCLEEALGSITNRCQQFEIKIQGHLESVFHELRTSVAEVENRGADMLRRFEELRKKDDVFEEQLRIIFPRAAAQPDMAAEFSVSEAKLFALDKRLDAVESQVRQERANAKEMRGWRSSAPSSTLPEQAGAQTGDTLKSVHNVDRQHSDHAKDRIHRGKWKAATCASHFSPRGLHVGRTKSDRQQREGETHKPASPLANPASKVSNASDVPEHSRVQPPWRPAGPAPEQRRPSLNASAADSDSDNGILRGHSGSCSRDGSRRPSEAASDAGSDRLADVDGQVCTRRHMRRKRPSRTRPPQVETSGGQQVSTARERASNEMLEDAGEVGDEVEDLPTRSGMIWSSEPSPASKFIAAELKRKSKQNFGTAKMLGPRDFRHMKRGDAGKRRISPRMPSPSPGGHSWSPPPSLESQVGGRPMIGSPSPHVASSHASPAAEHRRVRHISRSLSPPELKTPVDAKQLQVLGSPV